MNIDELSPPTIGEDKIVLALDSSSASPQAFHLVQINIDYSKTFPEGVVLPLDMIVQGPEADSYKERVFRKYKPKSLSFVPLAAGEHLILLREQAHNRWIGRLVITVLGDPFQKV